MARTALRTEDIKIDQNDPVETDDDRGGITQADASAVDKDYLAEIAFMEEPVTIRIMSSGGENPVSHYPVWVNGRGAEVLINGQWRTMTYLPVEQEITIKRKYVSVLARSKQDRIETDILDRQADNPRNIVNRRTSATCNFMVLHDPSPRGPARLAEDRRQNY